MKPIRLNEAFLQCVQKVSSRCPTIKCYVSEVTLTQYMVNRITAWLNDRTECENGGMLENEQDTSHQMNFNRNSMGVALSSEDGLLPSPIMPILLQPAWRGGKSFARPRNRRLLLDLGHWVETSVEFIIICLSFNTANRNLTFCFFRCLDRSNLRQVWLEFRPI